MGLAIDFQGQIWNSPILGMGQLIDIEQSGCESVIHDHDLEILMTKVRCKDLPDSDQGDFRCLCAVDSSSYINYKVWDEITYPFPNFNGTTVEVWEWLK